MGKPAVPAPRAGSRLFYLDVVRGVAILLVLGHHTPAVIRVHPVLDAVSDAVHDMGYLGVDLFFVLSGFLIGGLLFRELDRTGTLRVRRFLARRAFKIWPAYLVCLVVTCVAMAAVGKDLATGPHPYATIGTAMWPAAIHVQNYAPSTGFCSWFWSLGVEEHFYLILPVVLLAVSACRDGRVLRRVLVLTLTAAIACLALRGWTLARHPVFEGYTHSFPTHLRIDSLMAGVALVALTRYAPAFVERLRPWRWLLLAAGIAVFLLPVFVPGEHPKLFSHLYPFDFTLMWLAGMAVVLFAHFADEDAGMRPRRWFERLLNPVAIIGLFSYSIYLWHGFFAAPISKRLMEWSGVPLFGTGGSTIIHLGLFLAVAIGMGMLSYLLVEWPFLALRDRAFPARPAGAGVLR